MYNFDVKFALNLEDYDYSLIKDIFNKANPILNWRFDENRNVKLIDEDIAYQIKDISNLNESDVEEIIKSFFDFTFENIIDVPLYKFLVLENNEKLTILANISSLIFDYKSTNDFYELFNNLNKPAPKNDMVSYYKHVNNYLDSFEFKKDSHYWKNSILNSSSNVKFYNIENGNYKSHTIQIHDDSVLNFIENQKCSLFDFYGSVISLYLSRIDRFDGCLLKTVISTEKSDFELFDKNTYLKIDVDNNDSFNNLLIDSIQL